MAKSYYEKVSKKLMRNSAYTLVLMPKIDGKDIKGSFKENLMSILYNLHYGIFILINLLIYLTYNFISEVIAIPLLFGILVFIIYMFISERVVFNRMFVDKSYKYIHMDWILTTYGLIYRFRRFFLRHSIFKILKKLNSSVKYSEISIEEFQNKEEYHFRRLIYVLCYLNEDSLNKGVTSEIRRYEHMVFLFKIYKMVEHIDNKDNNTKLSVYKLVTEEFYLGVSKLTQAISTKDFEFIEKYCKVYENLPENTILNFIQILFEEQEVSGDLSYDSLLRIIEAFEKKYKIKSSDIVAFTKEASSINLKKQV